jgi:phage tail sheath protein FI
MSSSAAIPGLYYTFVRPPAEPSPVRTDIAGFFGLTARGPLCTPVRVAGWREYMDVFGGLNAGAITSYAVNGYFNNDAEVAYIVRLLGAGSQAATGTWNVGTIDATTGKLDPDWPGAGGFQAIQYQIIASSPGTWANNATVAIRYWAKGPAGKPELEFAVTPQNESGEILSGIDPGCVVDEVNAQSKFIQLQATPLPAGVTVAALSATAGPTYLEWQGSVPPRSQATLSGGVTVAPEKKDFLDAVRVLGDQIEVALVVSPDLYSACTIDESDQIEIITAMLTQAALLHDRLVILDVPPAHADALDAVAWFDSEFRAVLPEATLQNAAVYHPRVKVPDPLGGVVNPLRCVPCAGLVAGVVSRLDLQEGAYFTPANAPITSAVDLSQSLDANDQAAIYAGGLNLLKCSPTQGLLVWGGRVLGKDLLGGYVAHRRLIHLLVRSIRRVAEPLVFDTNGPQLWLSFVRSITTVLLEAFRAGALQGATPDQAFRVQCDASTNPASQIEQGMVVCLVQVAPAVPMEFITLRVSVSAQGQLEVFES